MTCPKPYNEVNARSIHLVSQIGVNQLCSAGDLDIRVPITLNFNNNFWDERFISRPEWSRNADIGPLLSARYHLAVYDCWVPTLKIVLEPRRYTPSDVFFVMRAVIVVIVLAQPSNEPIIVDQRIIRVRNPTLQSSERFDHDFKQVLGSCYKLRFSMQKQPSYIGDCRRVPRLHSPALR